MRPRSPAPARSRRRAATAAIETLVTAAAEATPARAPAILTLAPALLRSFEGTYQSASSGASVKVTFEGGPLLLTAEGQDALRLQTIEERRFVAENAPEINVAFARPRRHRRATLDPAGNRCGALRT